ncbi:hypothetical protein DOTSEDRAFT_41508 [Dothistroma septosporum NZE10]|uniref:Uncharacterized protein n=1 Tax=Dothistroma septosporum (strain NZE10 / CBS 128990) TaxID=675120 RepID=N1PVK0_DOTSN|nr:hypothetical protein DOTSEDRAFT_41508 [Dothistroma septosporum NZE10]
MSAVMLADVSSSLRWSDRLVWEDLSESGGWTVSPQLVVIDLIATESSSTPSVVITYLTRPYRAGVLPAAAGRSYASLGIA